MIKNIKKKLGEQKEKIKELKNINFYDLEDNQKEKILKTEKEELKKYIFLKTLNETMEGKKKNE